MAGSERGMLFILTVIAFAAGTLFGQSVLSSQDENLALVYQCIEELKTR